MRTLERYLARQIYGATAFVLLGPRLRFFDLIRELADLGKVEYHLRRFSLSCCSPCRPTPTSSFRWWC